MNESHFVENAAPTLIERLDELGRVGDLRLSLEELRDQLVNTPAFAILDSEMYGQLILERARELVNIQNSNT